MANSDSDADGVTTEAATSATTDEEIRQGLRALGLEPGLDDEQDDEAKPTDGAPQHEKVEPAKVEPPADEVPLDDAAKKQLEAQQAWDRKRKEMAAKDRAEIDAVKAKLEAEWKPKIEQAEEFEALKGKGVVGAMAALQKLGITPDEYALLAPAVWALSPKGSADPAAKARAAATLAAAGTNKEIEAAKAEAAAARKAVEDLTAKLTAREQEAQQQAAVQKYMAEVEAAAATVDAPLVRRMAEKAPNRVRELYSRVAIDLYDRDGGTPDHKAVVAEAERRERADLAERGIDVAQLLAPAKPPAANGKRPGPTLSNAGAGAVAPAGKPKTGRELDDEVREGLRKLNSSGSV